MIINFLSKTHIQLLSVLLSPIGIVILYIIARVSQVIILEQEAWISAGLVSVLACLAVIVIYAFLFIPWRLWKKFDSDALDGFAITLSTVMMFICSLFSRMIAWKLGSAGICIALLAWVGLFVILRALLHCRFDKGEHIGARSPEN